MADYWKSLEKKFCDTCKCWLADNKASIEFHENGKRHKENVQKRLKDIQKKNRQDDRKEKKLDYDMKMIEKAAMASMQKDMEENPDMSMKLQAYYDKIQSEPGRADADSANSASASSSSNQPKISHRSEKEKKAEEARLAKLQKPVQPYSRSGGWNTIQQAGNVDLELPSSSSHHQFVAKQTEKRKPQIHFSEKTVSSISSGTSTSSSSFTSVKTEPEIAFKKRRVDKSNMRRRDDNS